SGNHLDHLRGVLDTTPDAMRDVLARPALPATAPDLPDLPDLPRGGRHDEPRIDDEFAAELEVGLVDELGNDLVPTPGGTSNGGALDPDGGPHGFRLSRDDA
ncbi:MAG TPA: hypothetical protein VF892_18715, partial [Pseudonocardiaceae bacterium]